MIINKQPYVKGPIIHFKMNKIYVWSRKLFYVYLGNIDWRFHLLDYFFFFQKSVWFNKFYKYYNDVSIKHEKSYVRQAYVL